MASNLFAIQGNSSSTATQAYASQQSGNKSTDGSDFARLLAGNNTPQNKPIAPPKNIAAASQPTPPAQPAPTSETPRRPEASSTREPESTDVAEDTVSEDEIDGTEAVPVAAAPVLPPPPIVTTDAVALIDGIEQLRADMAAGKTVDPELLAKIDAALTSLAKQLGIDLDALASVDDIATLLNGVPNDDSSAEGLFATLIKSLNNAKTGAELAPQNAEVSQAVADITDKLSKILGAIDSESVDAAKLNTLGLVADKPRPNEIEQALVRLANTTSEKPAGPVLASPSLKLSEPLLVGKADEPTEVTSEFKTAQVTPTDTKQENTSSDKGEDRPTFASRQANAGPAQAQAAEAPAAPVQTAEVQPLTTTDVRVDASTLRTIAPVYLSSQQQLNIPQIAFEMSRQMQGGVSSFQIRLDPAELGRIDVRLDIDQNGNINAKLFVEKSETLDMMQRDQRALERALQQAGIDSNRANLEFSLKQNDQHANRDGSSSHRGFFNDETAPEAVAETTPPVTLYRGSLPESGLNILA